MCMMCDWGSEELFGEAVEEDPEAAAERRRVSQDSWSRLMEEIARADSAPVESRDG